MSEEPFDWLEYYEKKRASKPPKKEESVISGIMGAIKQVPSNLAEFERGAVQQAVNFPAQIANLALPEKMRLPLVNTGDKGGYYEAGKILGDIGNFAAGGGPLNAARQAAESIPLIGQIAKAFGGGGVSGIGRRAVGSAAYGGVTSPDYSSGDAITSGLTSAVLDSIGGGIGKLRPTNLFRGQLSPEELGRNLEAAKGTETQLGEVIQSPALKKIYETILQPVPFSGVQDQLGRVKQQLQAGGESLVNAYSRGMDPVAARDSLANSLKGAYNSQRTIKDELYGIPERIASEISFSPTLENFRNVTEKYKDVLANSSFAKFYPEVKSMINKVSSSGNDALDLKSANMLAGRLRELSDMHKTSPDTESMMMSGLLRNASSALKEDIMSSIKASGNKDLLKTYLDAEKNYAKNYSGFLDKKIYKYLAGEKGADDIIQDFLKTGRNNDKGDELNKLLKVLPPEGRDALKFAYLSKAFDEVGGEKSFNPSKLIRIWRDELGDKQKRVLFDKDEIKQFDKYARFANMNREAVDRMRNPKTGYRNNALATAATAIGAFQGGPLGAITPIALMAAGNKISKNLTSDEYRREFIRKMLSQDLRGESDTSAKLNAILQGLMANGRGG